MSPWHVMLGLRGRIGRAAFGIGLVVSAALFVLGIKASGLLLPIMAELLAPHGINAGFALNVLWLAIGLVFVWSVIAIGAKRLRDRGRSAWWIVVVVVPLAALALVNDAIFLVSRHFTLQREIQIAVIIDSVVIGLWVFAECLLGPSVETTPHKLPTREAPSS